MQQSEEHGTDAAAPTLADILDPERLTALVADRYIRVQRHPSLPPRIYNYTEKAQFGCVWTPETPTCRGLIVDDGDREDLVLLAVVDNATGLDLPLPTTWPGPVVERFDGLTDLAAITAQQRDNAEGFVLRYASGLRVKVKHAEYLRLHRILLGLSNVAV